MEKYITYKDGIRSQNSEMWNGFSKNALEVYARAKDPPETASSNLTPHDSSLKVSMTLT